MKACFYDIESLNNVFTLCNYKEYKNEIDVFILCDTPALMQSPHFMEHLSKAIYDANHNFTGSINVYNLANEHDARVLARLIGVSNANNVNDKYSASDFPSEFRPVCDTDPEYNEDEQPYLFGYNSYNYDLTMLAKYFEMSWQLNQHVVKTDKTPDNNRFMSLDDMINNSKAQQATPVVSNRKFSDNTDTSIQSTCVFSPVTAYELRQFNDCLFSKTFKHNMPSALACEFVCGKHNDAYLDSNNKNYKSVGWKLRKSMLMSGRHLDVARLNEKLYKVALKRLLGMLGYQILESDKLGQGRDTIMTQQELYELIAYNVSDVVNLAELFRHPFYQGQYSLKHGLIKTYPEVIYNKKYDSYEPNIDTKNVRYDRLTVDSSSAKFATFSLCPYGYLSDLQSVSYLYPSDRKVAELKAKGEKVEQINVLEESKKFFYKHFEQPELRIKFDAIYNYYKNIEGRNFNDSESYMKDYGESDVDKLNDIPKCENNMFYYKADGTPSNCFVTFSTGGIHGAEYNKKRYDKDMSEWNKLKDDFAFVMDKYPNPLDLRKAKTVTTPDGVEHSYKDFLVSSATIKAMTAAQPSSYLSFYKDINAKKPILFKANSDGTTKLNPDYVYTSAALCNHEDFTSYYPNMLRMMSAFWNESLGIDRYGEIFDNKQKYGKLMKDKSLSKEERELYAVLRQGTKLILNSASGAGDTNFGLPIQMNNRIISMRIIGQLFTWRIGQAQTLAGASIISTNTDGLYSVMEEKQNNVILAKESADIGVEIIPEPTYLISKDANNRMEIDPTTNKVESASGGTLACRDDTTPTKALPHPAIIDWALSEYLIIMAKTNNKPELDEEFDDNLGKEILAKSFDTFTDKAHLLRMYQNVLASSIESVNYIFATKENDPTPIILQRYNRVFIMKDTTPDTVHLYAANAKKITPATKAKRTRNNERAIQHDEVALNVLSKNGVMEADLPMLTEATIKKVTNIDPKWHMLVENHSLYTMSDERILWITQNLDMSKYLELLKKAYNDNWRNKI